MKTYQAKIMAFLLIIFTLQVDAQIIVSGAGAFSSDGGRNCVWCGTLTQQIFTGPAGLPGEFCSQRCVNEALKSKGESAGAGQSEGGRVGGIGNPFTALKKSADEGWNSFIKDVKKQKEQFEVFEEENRKTEISERASRDESALAKTVGGVVFPEPIMGFTLGMTLAELEQVASARNAKLKIQYSPFQLHEMMGSGSYGIWDICDTSPREYLNNNTASYYLVDPLLEGLEAEWVEVCFIEGRLVGVYTAFKDDELKQQVFDRLTSKYPVVKRGENSVLLNVSDHTLLLAPEGCAFFNVPLVLHSQKLTEEAKRSAEEDRKSKNKQVLDAL